MERFKEIVFIAPNKVCAVFDVYFFYIGSNMVVSSVFRPGMVVWCL